MGYITCIKGRPQKLSEHFNSSEFDCHGRSCCSSTLVNETLVLYLEKIRTHFGAPITITSGYRCPTHNRSVNGATSSRHARGDAVDIVVHGVAPREVAKYAESIGVLGIGLYETSNDGFFVHIDTRTTKSFWYGQAQKYRSTFGGASATTGSITSGSTTINNTNTTGTSTFILSRGDTGEEVRILQNNLIKLGYSCGIYGSDGSFGAATESAVRLFQKEYGGISMDGIAGCQTLAAVQEALNASAFRGRITANVLNVRSGMGTNFNIVSTVLRGATRLILGESNGWGKLHSPSGYISMQYVQKL